MSLVIGMKLNTGNKRTVILGADRAVIRDERRVGPERKLHLVEGMPVVVGEVGDVSKLQKAMWVFRKMLQEKLGGSFSIESLREHLLYPEEEYLEKLRNIEKEYILIIGATDEDEACLWKMCGEDVIEEEWLMEGSGSAFLTHLLFREIYAKNVNLTIEEAARFISFLINLAATHTGTVSRNCDIFLLMDGKIKKLNSSSKALLIHESKTLLEWWKMANYGITMLDERKLWDLEEKIWRGLGKKKKEKRNEAIIVDSAYNKEKIYEEIEKLLKDRGFKLSTVSSWKKAKEVVFDKLEDIGILVMEKAIERKNSLKLLKEIKKQARDIIPFPVVLFSRIRYDEEIEGFLRAGVSLYISKDEVPEKILEFFKGLLRTGEYVWEDVM